MTIAEFAPTGLPPLVTELVADVRRSNWFDLGYPRSMDLPYPELGEVLTSVGLVNVGDPWEPGAVRHQSKVAEQQVIDLIGGLIGAPAGSRWGFLTSSSSAAIEHALVEAQFSFGDVVVYYSQSAHSCVTTSIRKLRLPAVAVRAAECGSMDIEDLRAELSHRRDRPVMIVATLGTTMSEAIDDLAAIGQVCRDLALPQVRVHADAALAGIPLALMQPSARPAATFAEVPELTSWSTSAHKFLASREVGGVLIYRTRPGTARQQVAYTGVDDVTLTCSRSGHLPLVLLYQLNRISWAQHHARAEAARKLATYAAERLQSIGWPCWRNPLAFTVVLAKPPSVVTDRWHLAGQGQWVHLVCMPGISLEQIDDFLDDLEAALPSQTAGEPTGWHTPATA